MNTANSPDITFGTLLQKTLRCSRYVKRMLETDHALNDWLEKNYTTPCSRTEMLALLRQSGMNLYDEAELARAMRMLRKRVMVKLILRDLNGLADLNEVMQTMTALAEECVGHALACLSPILHAQFGRPLGALSAQELLVIGMGKLGGGELNVSSDIDLIFLYPEDGETEGPRKISNSDFFTRLGRRLINIIDEPSKDGYVFRVDMRLRPYGESGPLVMSFAALEEYLLAQGREWERYAWIKARVIAPPEKSGRPSLHVAELMQLVQPFVFRKYLDFGAIDSMRKLHAQIRQEVRRRDRLNNIKLGPGGIREIEFIAQVFQLIRGGQDAKLRIRPTVKVLQQLGENAQLSIPMIADLITAYVFLRNLEHRLQYLDDQQTQELPGKPEDQMIIADTMGYPDYVGLSKELDRHRALVSLQFGQIFGTQIEEQVDAQPWREDITLEELGAALETMGFPAARESAQRLLQMRAGSRYRQLPELSRQRLDKLIPQFMKLSAQHSDPDATLSRLLALLDAIGRRASYLAFLAEYPQALQRLTSLVSASDWASNYLTLHPALLDELLDDREIYQTPQWEKFGRDLESRLDDITGDTERQLDVLRHAQQEQIFHLLAMDLQGLLPVETLGDHLSTLADLMLCQVLRLSWAGTRKKHRNDARFAIIAYGKLGGKELGYASDLDLIFLYDDDHPDAQENYARLAQHINAMLGSYTGAGRLYETDLRLRPNGASGLLVSSIGAFTEYQHEHAWVWEHQALTRARFCAGNIQVGTAFEQIRKDVLCKQRDLAMLRNEILKMRQKMHDAHKNGSGLFDIKHDSGGMVDIEFMVQYLVLAYSHRYPQLAENIGNMALLKSATDLDLIPDDLARQTSELYRSLRQMQHRMRLNSLSPYRVAQKETDTRASRQLWNKIFGVD